MDDIDFSSLGGLATKIGLGTGSGLPAFDFNAPDFSLTSSTNPIGLGKGLNFSLPDVDFSKLSDWLPSLGTAGTTPGLAGLVQAGGSAALDALLSKGGTALSKALGFAKENPFTAGGLSGAALMALLSSMGNNQQQAPQYIGLGAKGAAPAAPAPTIIALPSQAQSYESMMGGKGMKDGGVVHMKSGDYVFSKKAMDKVGGIEGLKKRGYPAKKIVGPGTGTSDSIPATIDGQPVARVANGEALIPGGAKMKGLAGLHARMRKGK